MKKLRGWILVLCGSTSAFGALEPVSFNQHIRPILSDACFHCHGPDESSRKADLRLDRYEDAIRPARSGSPAIAPGKPEASELLARILSADPEEVMPPKESHKKLEAAQIGLLKRWIREGATYEAHWAYTPIQKPSIPRVEDALNPIDAFISTTLRKHSPFEWIEADKRTLLRRLSLDLLGLAPTEVDYQNFLDDPRPDAYERQVDRLLASPHFGERMAVWWLDLARFADSVGYHGDQNQRIYPYRDYVIDAFNKNKPFDEFTIEQLAGDLLPNPTDEQWAATGFNRLNMMTREGGAQPEEYLIKYAADRVRTVGGAWLGSTLGCSECHDHKFDPFTAKDFYAMAAFFSDMKQWGVYGDYAYTPNPDLRGVNNEYPFYPEREVQNLAAQSRFISAENRMKEVLQAYQQHLSEDPEQWQQIHKFWSDQGLSDAINWKPLPLSVKAKDLNKPASETVLFKPNDVKSEVQLQYIHLGELTHIGALRVSLLPRDGSYLIHSKTYPPRQTWEFLLLRAGQKEAKPLRVELSQADVALPFFQNGKEILGVHQRWLLPEKAESEKAVHAVLVPQEVTEIRKGDAILIKLQGRQVQALTLESSPLVPCDLAQSHKLEVFSSVPNPNEHAAFQQFLHGALLLDPKSADLRLSYLQAWREKMESQNGRAPTMVTETFPTARVVRILPRGNWMDNSGDIVKPYPPEFLTKKGNKSSWNRLDLAKWLVSKENPLTARATVNRWWKMFFGNGLSAVVDDLGAQGEWPSHPELLDWLANEFQTKGWDVKHMLRVMVTSKAYRQTTERQVDLSQFDPSNRWLSHQNPRRLDAEFIRDHHLQVSGLLNPAIGGPSVKPFQPEGYFDGLQFPNRSYIVSEGPERYKRGVYMHWQRTFLHPMLSNFDAPMRDECIAARPYSNTPQQALTLLNDPVFVEAAQSLAKEMMAYPKEQRMDGIFHQVLGRPAVEEEKKAMQEMIADLSEKGTTSSELQVWEQIARVMLNLHESITKF